MTIPRGTRVRPRPGSVTAGLIGTDAAGKENTGVVDASGTDDAGVEHLWVLLDGGGYVQGEASTEWETVDA